MQWHGREKSQQLHWSRAETRELDTLKTFDAFDEISELPLGHKAYDKVWVDDWREDKVR